MKKLLVQYSAYNLWANKLMIDYLHHQVALLPELSYKNVIEVLRHMWDEESIWWQRMKLQERITIPSETATGEIADICTGLLQQSKQWHEWILTANDHVFDHEFIYLNSKRDQFKQTVGQTLLHVFNNASYQRGALTVQLRQLKINDVPQTDFVVWSRKRTG